MANNIIITKKGTVATGKGPEDWFTGEVGVQMLASKRGESRLSAGLVTFQPGARTAWPADCAA